MTKGSIGPLSPESGRAAALSNVLQLRTVEFRRVCVAHERRSRRGPLTPVYDPTDMLAFFDRKSVVVQLPFVLSVQHEDEEIGRIEIEVVLVYWGKENAAAPSAEDVAHYCGVTSYLHAWPYIRAEVQSLTTKVGLPPLTLPTIVAGHAEKRVKVTCTETTLRQPKRIARKSAKRADDDK